MRFRATRWDGFRLQEEQALLSGPGSAHPAHSVQRWAPRGERRQELGGPAGGRGASVTGSEVTQGWPQARRACWEGDVVGASADAHSGEPVAAGRARAGPPLGGDWTGRHSHRAAPCTASGVVGGAHCPLGAVHCWPRRRWRSLGGPCRAVGAAALREAGRPAWKGCGAVSASVRSLNASRPRNSRRAVSAADRGLDRVRQPFPRKTRGTPGTDGHFPCTGLPAARGRHPSLRDETRFSRTSLPCGRRSAAGTSGPGSQTDTGCVPLRL